MFYGEKIGKFDSKNKEICCGDRISFYEKRHGYRKTSTQDGWGRDIKLCEHDQRDIPPREKTITGTVTYDRESCSFIVEFDEYMLESGRKKESLYMLFGSNLEGDIRQITIII